MLALLALQPPGFGAFAEPAPGVPPRGAGELLDARAGGGEKTTYSTDTSGTCSDYRAWKGHEEKDCAHYAFHEWCPKYKEDFSPSGVKAKDACCSCGGGVKDADKTCRAIGYKPDAGLGEACEAIGYKQEDLAAQVTQLKAQSAQTNELLTQLAQSAAQRNILELMSAKAAGRKAAELKAAGFAAAALKAAGFSAAELKAAGFSAAELKAAGIFTTKSELQAALTGDTSDIENWDVSLIDDFSKMFRDAVSFDADLSEWDVAQGTNFDRMFQHANSFDADLSKWNVAKGTSFYGMFLNANSFDADLSKWNVAQGTDFDYMFMRASSFNADLSKWNVAKGTYFAGMFGGTACTATNCGCTSCA